eukprot:GEMP01017485.1.p1 GENE.GEMP01017485.1~~GEMP01017485.1.p1  ORF type:complete len:462 (+),score=88.56 GEMP01017485.1:284-1669(+)
MDFLHFLTQPTRQLAPRTHLHRHSTATHEYQPVHTDIASASSDDHPTPEYLAVHTDFASASSDDHPTPNYLDLRADIASASFDDHPTQPGYQCVPLHDENDDGDALQSDAAPTTRPFPSFFQHFNDYLSDDRSACEYFSVPESDPEDDRAVDKASHNVSGRKCRAASSSTAPACMSAAPHGAEDSATASVRCSVLECRYAAGGYVEFALDMEHCTGMRWRIWRRFSRLARLHEHLVHTYSNTPHFPKKSWAILKDEHFFQRRKEALQRYFDIVLGNGFAQDTRVAAELGIRPPETPVALRVVPPLLEIRQGADAVHIPAQEYRVTFCNGMNLSTSLCVDARGNITYCSLPFSEGVYTVSVEAINAFGESDPITITVRLDSVQPSHTCLTSPSSAHSAVPLHPPSHQHAVQGVPRQLPNSYGDAHAFACPAHGGSSSAVPDNRTSPSARRRSLLSAISASFQ